MWLKSRRQAKGLFDTFLTSLDLIPYLKNYGSRYLWEL